MTMTRSNLPRVIGITGVAFAAFNCVVGVGIFGLPGLVAGVLGPAAIAAYVVCLVLFGLIALCLAEAGSRVSSPGGLYAYASAAYGPVMGGVTGVLFLCASSIGSAAAIARFFLDTLAGIWPRVADPVWGLVVLVLVYGTLTLINIAGTRGGNRLTILIGILKLAPLALLVIAGAFFVDPAKLAWHGWPATSKVADGALLLFFAFVGLESGLNICGETKDPARTIPRAIALAICMIAFLYVGLQVVAQGVLGTALAKSSSPLVDMARVIFGPGGGYLLVLLTLVSASGFMAADMLGSPRIIHALAHSGQLPRWFGSEHRRFATPAVAIVTYATIVVAIAATGSFRQIALLAVSGTLVLYLICCLGVLLLRARKISDSGQPFVVPGGPVVPILAAAISVWLLSTLAASEMIATAAFVVVVALLYFAQQAIVKPAPQAGGPE